VRGVLVGNLAGADMTEIFGNPAFMVVIKLLAIVSAIGLFNAIRADWQTFKTMDGDKL